MIMANFSIRNTPSQESVSCRIGASLLRNRVLLCIRCIRCRLSRIRCYRYVPYQIASIPLLEVSRRAQCITVAVDGTDFLNFFVRKRSS